MSRSDILGGASEGELPYLRAIIGSGSTKRTTPDDQKIVVSGFDENVEGLEGEGKVMMIPCVSWRKQFNILVALYVFTFSKNVPIFLVRSKR